MRGAYEIRVHFERLLKTTDKKYIFWQSYGETVEYEKNAYRRLSFMILGSWMF